MDTTRRRSKTKRLVWSGHKIEVECTVEAALQSLRCANEYLSEARASFSLAEQILRCVCRKEVHSSSPSSWKKRKPPARRKVLASGERKGSRQDSSRAGVGETTGISSDARTVERKRSEGGQPWEIEE